MTPKWKRDLFDLTRGQEFIGLGMHTPFLTRSKFALREEIFTGINFREICFGTFRGN